MGINLRTKETKEKLINLITESQLPVCVLKMIFEDFTRQLERLEIDTIQKELEEEKYSNMINTEQGEFVNEVVNDKEDNGE